MNKRLALAVAFASMFAAIPAANAGSVTGGFNVTVTLTSKCEVVSGPTDVAFNYTSFQAGAASPLPGSGAYQVRCTNSLPYTMALDATSGTVAGLNYTLSLSAAAGTGNGAAQGYTVGGSIASGQAGTCNLGSCPGSDPRVLTVSY